MRFSPFFLIRGLAGAAALAVTLSVAQAAPADYRFDLAASRSVGANKTEVSVRLVRLRDGKPVPGAVIFASAADMAPEGMPQMAGKVTPEPVGAAAGEYGFLVDTAMAGHWMLRLSAKVQGEAGTVTGAIPFTRP